jgi:hypothetical protein
MTGCGNDGKKCNGKGASNDARAFANERRTGEPDGPPVLLV